MGENAFYGVFYLKPVRKVTGWSDGIIFTFTLTVQEVREAKAGLGAVQPSAKLKGDSFFLHILPTAISLLWILSENGALERK